MPMIERGLRDYPEGVEAIRNRHIAYNEEVAYVRQREIGKYAFVIRPDRDLDIGRVEHDRIKIRAAYKAGRRKARKLLPEIMTFLEGAKADFSSIKASMVEGDVSVSDVVKPSLVEDPTVVPEEKEGFGKSYEEHPEEISGRENKDIPEELFGKVKRDDTCDGADEEKFEGAPAPAAPAADEKGPDAATADTEAFDLEAADAATADAKPADTKPADVTSASLVESFGEEPAETVPEQDEDQKVRVQEVRAVILPEEEEELPAFQRPFPMDREPDRAAFAQDNDVKTEAAEDTPAAEAAEDIPAAEAVEEPAEETETAEAGVPLAEETKVEVEEPAAEETKAEAEEPEEAAEEASFEEAAAENVAEEAETEEAAAENVAEEAETEEAAVEEPVEEELKAEEPAAEEPAEEAEAAEAEKPVAEEAKAEEPAAEEPALEEPAVEAEESAEAVAVEHTDASEASVEADTVEEADGSNPFRYRKKGRKQKKVWKPGNMTALKEKAKDQTK